MKKLTFETRAKRAADRRRALLATAAAAAFTATTFWAPSAWSQPDPCATQGEWFCWVLSPQIARDGRSGALSNSGAGVA